MLLDPIRSVLAEKDPYPTTGAHYIFGYKNTSLQTPVVRFNELLNLY
jgi:hypothetical protein